MQLGGGGIDLIPAVISSKASALHKCKKHFILFFRNGCKLITLKKFKFNVNAVQKSKNTQKWLIGHTEPTGSVTKIIFLYVTSLNPQVFFKNTQLKSL